MDFKIRKSKKENSTGLHYNNMQTHYNSVLPPNPDALAYTREDRTKVAPKPELRTAEEGIGKRVEIVQRMRDNVVQRCWDGPIPGVNDHELIERYITLMGYAEAMRIKGSQSKTSAGPCLSIIYDPVVQQLYYGQNYKSGNSAQTRAYEEWLNGNTDESADVIIKNRIQAYITDIEAGNVALPEGHDARLAAHSEVRALDQALKARRARDMPVNDSTLGEMYLYNINLTRLFERGKIAPKNRCENCARITAGIQTVGHN